jgi:hypothetical protein
MERLAHGLSTDNLGGRDGGPLSPDIERKTEEELTGYLTGRMDQASRSST